MGEATKKTPSGTWVVIGLLLVGAIGAVVGWLVREVPKAGDPATRQAVTMPVR